VKGSIAAVLEKNTGKMPFEAQGKPALRRMARVE
jgi:hypothetical protein